MKKYLLSLLMLLLVGCGDPFKVVKSITLRHPEVSIEDIRKLDIEGRKLYFYKTETAILYTEYIGNYGIISNFTEECLFELP